MAHSAVLANALVKGYSLLTGWGEGLQSLPVDADTAAARCRLLPLSTPVCPDDRLRRATRECLLAVAAVEQALARSTQTRQDLAGPRTALVYASASAYAAANWAFLMEDKETGFYFPYTAPSAVPGEVTIHFALTGPYLTFLSGANAGIEALWQAVRLLMHDQCDRVVILGVETFSECEELYTAGRWLLGAPLVEVAACLILERHPALADVAYWAGSSQDGMAVLDQLPLRAGSVAAYLCLPTARDEHRLTQQLHTQRPDWATVRVGERVGTCLACTPLIGLLLALAEGKPQNVLLLSRWWDAWSVLRWPLIGG